ncbi:hypothetical protein BH20VER3_BH20VER3_19770 [soil metagenome]
MKTLREAFLIVESILFWAVVLLLAGIFEAGVLCAETVRGLFIHRTPSHPETMEEPSGAMVHRGHAAISSFWR